MSDLPQLGNDLDAIITHAKRDAYSSTAERIQAAVWRYRDAVMLLGSPDFDERQVRGAMIQGYLRLYGRIKPRVTTRVTHIRRKK